MSQDQPSHFLGLTDAQANRLWQYWRTEESIFNERFNLFLVLESVLFGVLILFFGQSNPIRDRKLILRLATFLGLTLTIVWAYVSARQNYVLEIVRRNVHHSLPVYVEVEKEIGRVRWPIHVRTLLSYVIPEIFILVWIVLLFID